MVTDYRAMESSTSRCTVAFKRKKLFGRNKIAGRSKVGGGDFSACGR